MCAFYATEIFDHPRLANVDYYFRLDTDSYIEGPSCYDPFEIMHQQNLAYGYRIYGLDVALATQGMWSLVDDWARQHTEVEERLVENGWEWPKKRVKEDMLNSSFPAFYNNFEIVRLSAFRTPAMRKWFEEIKRVPERIYKYRWGKSFSFGIHVLRYLTSSRRRAVAFRNS
jgi:mannosyltransferase